jgi:hypothetical protein
MPTSSPSPQEFDNSQHTAPSTADQQERSRFSRNTSSLAPSAAGAGSERLSNVDSTTATHGSATSDKTSDIGSVEGVRTKTLSALEHGGQSTSDSERTAEKLASAMHKNPQQAEDLRSSGARARERRRLLEG